MHLATTFDGASAEAHSRRWQAAGSALPPWYGNDTSGRWHLRHQHSHPRLALADAADGATASPAVAATVPDSSAMAGAGLLYSYRQSDSATLVIKTQEGDLVRISLRNESTSSASAVAANDGEQLAADIRLGASSSSSLRVYVHGNLSADELKAVGEVVNQAATLAEQFFNGNVADAFASAANLNVDASQLAAVGLRLREQAQLSYASTQLVQGSPLPEGNAQSIGDFLRALLAPAAAAPATATPAARPTAPGTPEVAVPDDAAPDAGSPRVSAPVAAAPEAVALRIRIVQMLAAQSTAAPAGSDLLQSTLDQLAARQGKPLDTSA